MISRNRFNQEGRYLYLEYLPILSDAISHSGGFYNPANNLVIGHSRKFATLFKRTIST